MEIFFFFQCMLHSSSNQRRRNFKLQEKSFFSFLERTRNTKSLNFFFHDSDSLTPFESPLQSRPGSAMVLIRTYRYTNVLKVRVSTFVNKVTDLPKKFKNEYEFQPVFLQIQLQLPERYINEYELQLQLQLQLQFFFVSGNPSVNFVQFLHKYQRNIGQKCHKQSNM